MTPYPDYKRIQKTLKRAMPLAIPFQGTLYRVCDPLYANTRDLLTGEGSRQYGGRWNAPGSFAVLYLSQSMEGAIAETVGLGGYYGFDPVARLPLTFVAMDATLQRVVDFTDPRVRKIIAVTLSGMRTCNWRHENTAGREALTQALGRAAFEEGADGIVVPSAARRSFNNLNLFPQNLRGKAQVTIRRSERLPPPPFGGRS
jgi:RES domain-containing protein